MVHLGGVKQRLLGAEVVMSPVKVLLVLPDGPGLVLVLPVIFLNEFLS